MLVSRYPDGMPATEIDALAEEQSGGPSPRLSIVNGH